MRATDLIRNVLDLIDDLETPKADLSIEVDNEEAPGGESRFKQIFAMLNHKHEPMLANSPNEVVAPVDSVTTLAGGGVNGPKHPADIRIKDPRGY